MKRRAARAIHQLYRLELYELVGLVASAAALLIFIAYSDRLSQTIGFKGNHWSTVNNLIGVYRHPLAWVFSAVLTLLCALAGFLRRANHQLLRNMTYVVRIMIAFCVMLAIYEVVNFYITAFQAQDRDIALQSIDKVICFGQLPSVWMESIISRPLTDILSGAYMSWYALTYVTILLMITHSRRAAVEYAFTALGTFYIGYLTYALVPAVGPIYTVVYTHPIGGLAAAFTASNGLLAHDCFPSLHTGITIVMLTFVWRYRRRWVWLYAPMTILILWSTLYLRFHYAVDLIAGFALAVVMTQVAPMMVSGWDRRRVKVRALEIQHLPKTQIAQKAMSELA